MQKVSPLPTPFSLSKTFEHMIKTPAGKIGGHFVIIGYPSQAFLMAVHYVSLALFHSPFPNWGRLFLCPDAYKKCEERNLRSSQCFYFGSQWKLFCSSLFSCSFGLSKEPPILSPDNPPITAPTIAQGIVPAIAPSGPAAIPMPAPILAPASNPAKAPPIAPFSEFFMS